MKNSLFLFMLTFLLYDCSTTNKITYEDFNDALIGQNELAVYSLIGRPSSIVPGSKGGKILLYEYYSKGKYLTPNSSNINYNSTQNMTGYGKGITFTSGVNTATNDPKYAIYSTTTSYLKVYLNNNGICDKIEQNLPPEQLEYFYDRIKRASPKK